VDIEDGGIELEEAEKDETTKNADALDLSASEDEEVMDDLLDDFVGDDPENRLYLFQFPPLFPTFAPPTEASQPTISKRRSVVFAEDTVGGGGAAGSSPSAKDEKVKAENPSDAQGDKAIPPPPRHEGQIGRLDVFRDGRVNFRFNDIIMEVTGGSQSSFLQQVMILDAEEKKATTLGELHRKFVVAPEVESMLNDVDQSYEAFNLSGSGGE
jgi:DNA-directed RNA polymerase III subunit RPC4